jgi:DNA-directed RNA polymerase specialized sigma24 family protein
MIDERCRELLHLLFYSAELPSYDEIARRSGVPVGSIGPTRARCFRKLEKALAELGFAGNQDG